MRIGRLPMRCPSAEGCRAKMTRARSQRIIGERIDQRNDGKRHHEADDQGVALHISAHDKPRGSANTVEQHSPPIHARPSVNRALQERICPIRVQSATCRRLRPVARRIHHGLTDAEPACTAPIVANGSRIIEPARNVPGQRGRSARPSGSRRRAIVRRTGQARSRATIPSGTTIRIARTARRPSSDLTCRQQLPQMGDQQQQRMADQQNVGENRRHDRFDRRRDHQSRQESSTTLGKLAITSIVGLMTRRGAAD